MKEITVYTTDFCSYCERAKALLRRRGLTYTETAAAAESGRLDELLAA